MTERDLSKLPMTAWGRHELEAEVLRLRSQNTKLEVELSGVTNALPSRGMWEASPSDLAAEYARMVTTLEERVKELESGLALKTRLLISAQAELALRKPLPSKHKR